MQPRIDPVLVVACGACAGAGLVLHPVATVLAGAGAIVLARRCVARGVLVLAGILALVGAVRAHRALAVAEAGHALVARGLAPPRECELDAVVASSPVVRRAGRRGRGPAGRADLRVVRSGCLGLGGVVRTYGLPEDLRRRDRLRLRARVGAVRPFRNPHATDPRVRVARTGIVASGASRAIVERRPGWGITTTIDAVRAHVRRRIERTYPALVAPMARALVLGESDLDERDGDAFRRSGLSHLLAVSGTHLVIAVVALVEALRAVLVRVAALAERVDVGRVVAVVGIASAWLYAELAGGGGSAYRAAAMLAFAYAARLMGRAVVPSRAFGLSLLGGALVEPLCAWDVSFALSVAATGGLIGAQAPVRALVDGAPRAVRTLLVASLSTVAATVCCAPVILLLGPDVPLLGIAANLLAAPAGELVGLPFALVHTVLPWWPAAERGAALVTSGALSVVAAVAHATADSAWATVAMPPPTAGQLGALLLGTLALALRRRRCLRGALWALLALELAAGRVGAPRGQLRVTVLDVGQGDAILVDLPDGSLMLVDGGGLVGSPVDPGRRVLLPELRARRRSRVDVAVLSHPHPDHYGGWRTALAAMPVGEIWDSGVTLQKPGPLARELQRRATGGVPLRTPAELCGAPRRLGGATVEVLSPCPGPDMLRSVNDNSLVLRIRYGDRAVLLAGDAEAEQEAAILARRAPLRADLLKVGHHGSRTSTTALWLDAVQPSAAAISCGVRNRFGHPHEPVEARLRRHVPTVLRTDRDGAITWRTDGTDHWMRAGTGPWRLLAP